jgi:hypothetical protein
MFVIRDNTAIKDMFNPLSHYEMGKVESHGHSHYLRKYQNVLWVMTDLGKDTFTAKRRVSNQYKVDEYKMDKEEIQEFQNRLESSKDLQKQPDSTSLNCL